MHDFGHFLHGGIHSRLRIVHFMSKFIQYAGEKKESGTYYWILNMKSTFTIIDHVFSSLWYIFIFCLSSIVLHLARGYFGHIDKSRWKAAAFRPLIGSFEQRWICMVTHLLWHGRLGFWVSCVGLPNSVTFYMKQGVFGTHSNQNVIETLSFHQHKKRVLLAIERHMYLSRHFFWWSLLSRFIWYNIQHSHIHVDMISSQV